MLLTYRTKLKNLDEKTIKYLEVFAQFFSKIERKLFVDAFIFKKSKVHCKNTYTAKYKITSRQFNALYMQIEGKVSSILELRTTYIEETEAKIKTVENTISMKLEQRLKQLEKLQKLQKILAHNHPKTIQALKKYRNTKFVIHQKKRKLRNLKQKLEKLRFDEVNNKIRISFGSKKLFLKQFNLKENNYKTHEEWLIDWRNTRSSQFLCLGSKDETFGNQTCTYDLENNLRLKVAPVFEKEYGQYSYFKNILFSYGQEELNKAKISYKGVTRGGKPKKYYRAITYRFIKKERGWYINASVEVDIPVVTTNNLGGFLGVDFNAGFISVCEIDRFGNPLKEWNIKIRTSGSSDQITASIGDAIKQLVEYAKKAEKSIAYENLDFTKKKALLIEENKKYSRMLSGLTYAKFKEMLEYKAKRFGVAIKKANPAYTSIIGQVKFMKRYGLSSHGSAACVIARRGYGLTTEQPNYNSLYALPKNFNKERSTFGNWISISNHLKKNYHFDERIELIKLDA